MEEDEGVNRAVKREHKKFFFLLSGKDGFRNEMTSLSQCVSRIHGDRCQKQAHFPKEEEIENWFPARTGGVPTWTRLTGSILKLSKGLTRPI